MSDVLCRPQPEANGGNKQALEFFATSLAALVNNPNEPAQILEDALAQFGNNKEELLSNKARETGYHDFRQFQEDLLSLIGQQLQGLQYCHLTAPERAQLRLIKAL